MTRHKGWRVLASLVALGTIAAACGDDSDAESTDTTAAGGTAATPGIAATTTAGATTSAAPTDIDPAGVVKVAVDLVANTGMKFDPVTMGTGSYVSASPVVRPLFQRNRAGQIVPDLAESAKVVDPTTVEVNLRPNLKFSDGTPVTAADVKATFERNLASNNSAGLQIADMGLVSTITADSATKFTIKLKDPSAGIIYAMLAGVEFAPVKDSSYTKDAAGKTVPVDNVKVIAAGPMMVSAVEPGVKITMVKNPNYIDAAKVRIAGMEYLHATPGAATLNALRSGQVDYAGGLGFADASSLPAPYKADQLPMTAAMTIQMCMKADNPLGNVKVRQAMAYAFDREAYNSTVFGGKSEVAWDLWPKSSPWHDTANENFYKRDVAKAKQLLTEAGYPNGVTLTMAAGAAVQRDMEVMQAQLKEAGITLNIAVSANIVTDFYNASPKYDMTFSQSRPGPLDKITRFYLSNSFSNVCKFPTPEVEAAFNKLKGLAIDSPDAIPAWKELQKVIVRDLALFPTMAFQVYSTAYNGDRLSGVEFYYDALGSRQLSPLSTYVKKK
ncbi:MAG: ABC transporter substrate-binding protein [Acidimicrobiia bacterium]